MEKLQNIRLVVSDVDGTLLTEGTSNLNKEMFDVIRGLNEQGIRFAAVSGRQYLSLKKLFAPVMNEIVFVADNGACNLMRDELISCYSFEKDILTDIVCYVRKMENVYMLASTPNGAYTECEDEDLNDWIRNGYKVDVEMVKNLLDVNEPIVKIAVFVRDVDASVAVEPMLEKFQENATVVVSGDHWIDFVPKGVNKGTAVTAIQESFQITPEETMAFGDNYNDISMLLQAKESYAVAGAREEVKKVVKHVLTDTSLDAVLHELKRVFAL